MNTVYIKLGKLLKLERERQNIKLESVSEELNISLGNLECIESGNADGLPSELYFNLFAKSYAEMLGIDFTKTVEAIREDVGEPMEADKPEAEEKGPRTKKEAKRERAKARPEGEGEDEEEDDNRRFLKKTIWMVGIVVGVFVVVLVAVLLFFGNGQDASESGAADEAVTAAEPHEVDEKTDADLASFEWSTPGSEAPSPLTLSVVAREQSWATILADGDTVIFRNLVPWREYTEQADYRFLISIAHPRLVEVKLNGKTVDLRDPESRRISRVEVNQINVGTFLEREPLEDEPPARRPSTPAPASVATVADTTQNVPIDTSQPDSQVTNEEH